MHCLITHDDTGGASVLNLVFNVYSTLYIRAAKALASLPTHIHKLTRVFIAQHCDK